MPVANRKKQTTIPKQELSIPGHIPSIVVPIEGIEEYEKNYNMHGQEQLTHLEQSLSDFGQFKNIIIWNGQCIAGNGLLMAARQRGDTHIEVKDYSHLTQQQAEALLIADNATPAGSIADVGKLQSLLSGLDGVKIPGVTPDWEALMGLNAPIFQPEQVEFDESVADKIEACTCPECGHRHTRATSTNEEETA